MGYGLSHEMGYAINGILGVKIPLKLNRSRTCILTHNKSQHRLRPPKEYERMGYGVRRFLVYYNCESHQQPASSSLVLVGTITMLAAGVTTLVLLARLLL